MNLCGMFSILILIELYLPNYSLIMEKLGLAVTFMKYFASVFFLIFLLKILTWNKKALMLIFLSDFSLFNLKITYNNNLIPVFSIIDSSIYTFINTSSQ